MDSGLTPIKASRELLVVLASHDTTEFENLLRPNAFLHIKSKHRRESYISSTAVSKALRREASGWSQPTINVQSWNEADNVATVQFEVWVKEQDLLDHREHFLTVMLRNKQIETIILR